VKIIKENLDPQGDPTDEEELEAQGGKIVSWQVDEVSNVDYPANDRPFSIVKSAKPLSSKDLRGLKDNGVDISKVNKQEDEQRDTILSAVSKMFGDFKTELKLLVSNNIMEEETVSIENKEKMEPPYDGTKYEDENMSAGVNTDTVDDVFKEVPAEIKAYIDQAMAGLRDEMKMAYGSKEAEVVVAEAAAPAAIEAAAPVVVEASADTAVIASIAGLADTMKAMMETQKAAQDQQTQLVQQVKSLTGVRPDGNALGEHEGQREEPAAPKAPTYYGMISKMAQDKYQGRA